MALYRPHYLPFYYLKVYYLFMHNSISFSAMNCFVVEHGGSKNAMAVDLASPGGELIQ